MFFLRTRFGIRRVIIRVNMGSIGGGMCVLFAQKSSSVFANDVEKCDNVHPPLQRNTQDMLVHRQEERGNKDLNNPQPELNSPNHLLQGSA